MTTYQERLAICLWQELAIVYPELAPEKQERDAEQDIVDLFGLPDEEEKETCQSKD